MRAVNWLAVGGIMPEPEDNLVLAELERMLATDSALRVAYDQFARSACPPAKASSRRARSGKGQRARLLTFGGIAGIGGVASTLLAFVVDVIPLAALGIIVVVAVATIVVYELSQPRGDGAGRPRRGPQRTD